jgi:hypothetical protein
MLEAGTRLWLLLVAQGFEDWVQGKIMFAMRETAAGLSLH